MCVRVCSEVCATPGKFLGGASKKPLKLERPLFTSHRTNNRGKRRRNVFDHTTNQCLATRLRRLDVGLYLSPSLHRQCDHTRAPLVNRHTLHHRAPHLFAWAGPWGSSRAVLEGKRKAIWVPGSFSISRETCGLRL